MPSRNNDFKKVMKQLASAVPSKNSNCEINNTPSSLLGSTTLITEIHEYCIKSILIEQAHGFYESFLIEELKSLLISRFIKMEQFKREDRYEEFCLAVFQQIETIVNYFFENDAVKDHIEKNRNQKACMKFDKVIEDYIPTGNKTLGDIIFFKNDLSWSAAAKYKAVLYVKYYNYNIGYNTDTFFAKCKTEREIYSIRNLVHGGVILSDSQQGKADLSLANRYRNYLKYIGFLDDFVSGVNSHLVNYD